MSDSTWAAAAYSTTTVAGDSSKQRAVHGDDIRLLRLLVQQPTIIVTATARNVQLVVRRRACSANSVIFSIALNFPDACPEPVLVK
eukprot:COSAG06_NODE_417_length_15986_cov_832.025493_5_plen_86_part_00